VQQLDEEIHTPLGKKMMVLPRALKTHEIPEVIEEFRNAVAMARIAGFAGVEIHGANGYLLDQFLRDGSNKRVDEYGGSLENRARFPLEVTRAVTGVWGADRVGYRMSLHFPPHSMADSDPRTTFRFLSGKLDDMGIGYIHFEESRGGRMGFVPPDNRIGGEIRAVYSGTLMVNGGYGAGTGNKAVSSGAADLVSFGVLYLVNPDLPERFRKGLPPNKEDPSTFYDGEERGYIDYPFSGA